MEGMLKHMQQMQWTISLEAEGMTTEKLIKEVW